MRCWYLDFLFANQYNHTCMVVSWFYDTMIRSETPAVHSSTLLFWTRCKHCGSVHGGARHPAAAGLGQVARVAPALLHLRPRSLYMYTISLHSKLTGYLMVLARCLNRHEYADTTCLRYLVRIFELLRSRASKTGLRFCKTFSDLLSEERPIGV